ncbi:NUDIX domain-containing protein [Nitrosophilus labii]|uniref:NUDIX domain-containing protein n=1 Tax=Nitrosophilus labii TaxID=2706014 RepID=UPI00165749D5|nr:NUDIX domain-containing protein [Nitrosophilus labii]
MKISAGILPFKCHKGDLKVFLIHMGGPFWKNRDDGAWSIVKGEVREGENILVAAKREFFEETGKKIEGDFIDLGEIKASNKIIHIFAINKDLDTDIKSNYFELEWPPKSGKIQKFPEADRAKWFDINEANRKIVKSQKVFLERLREKICRLYSF